MKKIQESIGRAAVNVAKEVSADAIVSLERPDAPVPSDTFEEFKKRLMSILTPPKTPVRVVMFKKSRRGAVNYRRRGEFVIEVKASPIEGAIFIKEAVMGIIREGWLKEGDRIVSVGDSSLGAGYSGLLFLFDIDRTFFEMSVLELDKNVGSDVLETVIALAKEVAKEGREGRHIGTAFIVGDSDAVLKRSRQLIINPFSGYAEEHRNITDPELKETIKEFAQLDGVFIIGADGTIYASGAYLNIDPEGVSVPSGLGSRHLACAAITKNTMAIAVAVSQSGGIIRVFKQGEMVMEEKPE
ncbi:MAG: diadenylate cyclase [Candidatus Undinarchaeales archaeon]|nr:diadenylate cyclase [Candidatus Undinarchaeales archaeon]MDP7494266.1 diadenylate cyclase [Candidatus Undinarchaeales archaeon]